MSEAARMAGFKGRQPWRAFKRLALRMEKKEGASILFFRSVDHQPRIKMATMRRFFPQLFHRAPVKDEIANRVRAAFAKVEKELEEQADEAVSRMVAPELDSLRLDLEKSNARVKVLLEVVGEYAARVEELEERVLGLERGA